ncbi:MAG: hypothetical protein Q8878_10095, partial [Bacillota bacterium]|nr:hypothetical protein [Bacillota bacterium]
VLSGLELQNKEIGDAIDITIKKINVSGYFSEGDSLAIEITVNNRDEDKTEKLADELKDRAEEETKEEGHKAVTVEAEGVGAARVKEAKALGVTPGKLNLVQKLQESNPDVKIDQAEWLKKPVKDIMKQIKENKKAKKALDKADKKGDPEKDAEKPSKSPANPPKTEIKDSGDKKTENKDKNVKTPSSGEKVKSKGKGGEKSSAGNKSK